jgi:hypothetical protein
MSPIWSIWHSGLATLNELETWSFMEIMDALEVIDIYREAEAKAYANSK